MLTASNLNELIALSQYDWFITSRKYTESLERFEGESHETPPGSPGYVYLDSYWIGYSESTKMYWTNVENMSYASSDLADVELWLWEHKI